METIAKPKSTDFYRMIVAFGLLFAVIVVTALALDYYAAPTPAPRVESPSVEVTARPPLLLLPINVQRNWSDNIKIEGQVKNVSGEKLENIWAIAEFYDSNGALVQSEEGFAQYSTLMPGQTSPFKIFARENPLIQRIIISGFRTTHGERVHHTTNW